MRKLILSIAFIGLGTFAMAQQTPTSGGKMNHEDMKQTMAMHQKNQLDKMKSELNLSDDQVAKIKAMQDQRMADRQKVMADKKNDMIQKKNNAKEQMKQILTPEQYTKWESNMKDKMDKGRARRMSHKDGVMKGDAMPMESK